MFIVKVHRVFPSNHKYFASSQRIQFHRNNTRDSREVVKPFMHVKTYLTRDFATLGPLQLQPPFTDTCIKKQTNIYSPFNIRTYSTGQVSDPIHHFTISQSPVFLINSRFPLFLYPPKRYSFSRSYRVNLPSSFNIITSKALVYYILTHLCQFQYGTKKFSSCFQTIFKSFHFENSYFIQKKKNE